MNILSQDVPSHTCRHVLHLYYRPFMWVSTAVVLSVTAQKCSRRGDKSKVKCPTYYYRRYSVAYSATAAQLSAVVPHTQRCRTCGRLYIAGAEVHCLRAQRCVWKYSTAQYLHIGIWSSIRRDMTVAREVSLSWQCPLIGHFLPLYQSTVSIKYICVAYMVTVSRHQPSSR